MTVRPGSFPGNVPLLVPRHGPGDRRPRAIDRDVTTVGRARGCDLCLEASDVSTIHCLVFRSGTAYLVRDCNSRAGTRVNGEAIRGDRPLHDGDIILVGPFSFEMRLPAVRRADTPAADAPAVDAPAADASQLQHCVQSRRRFAEHALRLRRLLREGGAGPVHPSDVQQEAARLRELTAVYERRLKELNETEHELQAEREQLRTRVQQVEREITERFEEAEQQVRQRWQEFQRRCQAEEAALVARMQQREVDSMKQALENGQANPPQQEALLRNQRAELVRMLGELKQLQAELRRPVQDQLKALAQENEQLRQALADYEARAAEGAGSPAAKRELEQTRAENDLLRMLLQERERELNATTERLTAQTADATASAVEPLRAENARLAHSLAEKEAELAAKNAVPKTATELESYEAELNQERQELERERTKLTQELEQMRARNQELDDATREMEMEMSRERAELARERVRMERMREELRVDMERLQREMGVRESLAPVQRLREELSQKRPAAKPPDSAADRLRQLRSGNDTPRS